MRLARAKWLPCLPGPGAGAVWKSWGGMDVFSRLEGRPGRRLGLPSRVLEGLGSTGGVDALRDWRRGVARCVGRAPRPAGGNCPSQSLCRCHITMDGASTPGIAQPEATYTPSAVLITGGAGFIASHVAIRLAKRYPQYKVQPGAWREAGRREGLVGRGAHSAGPLFSLADRRAGQARLLRQPEQPRFHQERPEFQGGAGLSGTPWGSCRGGDLVAILPQASQHGQRSPRSRHLRSSSRGTSSPWTC